MKSKRTLQQARDICYKINNGMSIQDLNRYSFLYVEYDNDFCEQCGMTGRILSKNGNEYLTDSCFCLMVRSQEIETNKKIQDSGIPNHYIDKEIKDWIDPSTNQNEKVINQQSIELIKKYCSSIQSMKIEGYGIFLCGPNGVGKTLLSCVIGKSVIRSGFSCKYYTLSRIVTMTIEGWFDAEEKRRRVKEIESCDFLIIDDCDKFHRTKTGIEITILDSTLRERVQNKKPIIFTSNQDLNGIKNIFTSSIYSMIIGQSAVAVILGEDFRKKNSDLIKKSILGH